MSGSSKFSNVLARLKDVPLPEPEAPSPPIDTKRAMGRPPGKRSDPGWSPRTIMMNRHTHKSVARILLDTDAEQDLSELIDELLKVWVAKQS
jgi:hypothetical protein